MKERINTINLHKPAWWRQLLEIIRLKEIAPEHLCSNQDDLISLYRVYPDLWGDRSEFDMGLGGYCQSWRDQRGWWKSLFY